MNAEWRRNPPMPLMVKAFLGIKDETPPTPSKHGLTALPEFATLPDIEE